MALRIVSIVSRMNVGGPAVLLHELATGLEDKNFEHILISGRCGINEIDYLETHSLRSKVIYLNRMGRKVLLFDDLIAFFQLIWTLRKLSPDIVHTHTSKAGLIGRLASLIAKPSAKRVHTFHGHLLYGYFSNLARNLVIISERVLARISDALIAVSTQVKSDLLQVRVGHLSHWEVITPSIKPVTMEKLHSRASLFISEDTFLISWVGRFTSIKDPILALKALDEVLQKGILNICLVMAGDGELLDECRDFAASRNLPVRFLGWQTDVLPALCAADLLLMTSRNEGMPVVILEAASFSVPTLSTRVGGVGEFISNNKTGFLVQRDSQQIANQIIHLMENKNALLDTGRVASKLLASNFNLEQYISKHINLYTSLMSDTK